MIQLRKTTGPDAAAIDGLRPLSARSIIASTLLGMDPPELPSRLLVRSGELFGVPRGTTRVALSRMVAAGEVEADGGAYRLAGRLLHRHARQIESRRPDRRWSGDWVLAVVTAERRDPVERSALRDATARLKLGELREGVWLRPDNLDPDREPDDRAVVATQCQVFVGRPSGVVAPEPGSVGADRELVAALWDLEGWAVRARALASELDRLLPLTAGGDDSSLADGFVVSAATLRHLVADPTLPVELQPEGWPGAGLRIAYERYEAAFKARWRAWFRDQS